MHVEQLVKRAHAHDRAAFGELYEMYGPKIYAYIRYSLNTQPQPAEDLTEEVFLKALQNIHNFQFTGAPFSAWLYRIARNHVIDHVRAQPKATAYSLDGDEQQYLQLESDAHRDFDLSVERHGLSEALKELTADQRDVILLRFMHDQTVSETARVMGKQEDAVKKLQSRALSSLKRILTRDDHNGR